ncbi:MAG: PadR family transcriptional regulator [Candidatus Brockarchaeota archaeon]|nr:PadR family transcriptional regulator [Candidatus Brockarchaeota archaeon]MBO3840851.1 PadR family transcriptional regulator [Candidatus Brockarchaeota archaeon]
MFRHWMRHMAYAPKGLLRYLVLEKLSEKPMSGSEIMDRIEEESHGAWRPSPGSIYPLLTWLHEKGFIKALPRDETGVKRYELTDKGRKLLEEKGKIRERLVERMVSFPLLLPPPPFVGRFPEDRLGGLHDPIKRLFAAFREFMILSRGRATEEDLAEVGRVLEEAAGKIEELNKRIRG